MSLEPPAVTAGQSSTPQPPVEAHPVPNGPQDLQLLLLMSLRPTGMRKCSCTELVLQSLGERWRWSDGDGAIPASPASPQLPVPAGHPTSSDQPWLQSPLLTQIALKGSGACARSLQARFMRFQGSPPPRPKFAAKNGTPLWQGDVLLVLAGGQGTSRALPPGGSDGSPKRGGGTGDVSPSQQPKDAPTHPSREGGRAAGAAAGQPRVPEHPQGPEQGLSCPGFILDQPRWLEKNKQAFRHASLASVCFFQALWLP